MAIVIIGEIVTYGEILLKFGGGRDEIIRTILPWIVKQQRTTSTGQTCISKPIIRPTRAVGSGKIRDIITIT